MSDNKCPVCEGGLARKRVPYSFAGVKLGEFQADVCAKCKEAFFTEEGWNKIERLAREKELWGTGRRITVGQSGHSLIVRIPSSIARATHIRKGSTLYVQPAGHGKVLLEKEED